jgi:uncharacterized protein YjdB
MGILTARLVKLSSMCAVVVVLLSCDIGKFAGPPVADPDSDEHRGNNSRPVDLYLESGSDQSGVAGRLLEDSIVVRATDRRGDPVPGVPVGFVVTAGGGSVEPTMGVTNADGRSARAWMLGVEGHQEVTAAIITEEWKVGNDSLVVFTAFLAPSGGGDGDSEAGTLSGLEVRPSTATLAPGMKHEFAAVGRMSDGSEETVPVAWSATGGEVDTQGIFTAAAQTGTFQVIAEHGDGQADTASVSIVDPESLAAQVVVAPATDTLVALGATRTFTARALDAAGEELSGIAFEWTSSESETATVDQGGKVTAKAVGSVLVMVAAAGLADSAWVIIRQEPASIEMDPAAMTLAVGETAAIGAVVRDAGGASIPDAQITWSSSADGVASYEEGIVTARSAGDAVITATSGQAGAEASVRVVANTEPPSGGIWISPARLAALPTSGPGWDNVKNAADSDLSGGVLSNRDDHNTRTMAAALVAARLDRDVYRAKVRESIRGVMTAPILDDELAIVRRLGAYAIAADLINLASFDPAFDQEFRAWLDQTRTREFPRGGVASIHERRPNNWGTHAGGSRIAAAVYLGDRAELERAATVFRGYLGDRSAYAGFTYKDNEWWQADPERPVGINPKGATLNGYPVDGVLPDDQRRGGEFTWPPPQENYVYTGLQGVLAQAVMLEQQGYDVWNWEDRAILRAFEWLHTHADYPAVGDDGWQPFIINMVYGTTFPAPSRMKPGKNIGWGEWTHQ